MENEYGKHAVLCVLLQLTWWVGRDVHLGDAALVPLGWILKKMGAKRVTVTVCGLDVIWQQHWYQWFLKKTFPSMDHVVCISNATAEEVRRRGVQEKKISVIPCGIWACHGEKNISHDDTFPILLTIGRLVKRKGHAWFIEKVLPLLIQEYSRLEYWIIGEGPERKRIESIIQKYVLESHVRLFGSVSDILREEYYRKADAFVMPNIPIPGDMEGFGIACIEASSRGIPVVAARLEGLQDAVIEGETGMFFESGNVEDCMTAIRNVLENSTPPCLSAVALAKGEGEGKGEVVKEYTLQHFSWTRLFQRYRDEVFHF